VPLRTDLVRTWPVGVDDLGAVVREGEAAGDVAPASAADTRPTPPEGGFLEVLDISLGCEAMMNGMERMYQGDTERQISLLRLPSEAS
jgi:hypothetical protein